MNSWVLQLAKREWGGTASYWIIGWLVGTGFCVLVQPFDTGRLGLLICAGYWLAVNAIALVIMFGTIQALARLRGPGFWVMALLGSLIFTCLFTPIIALINARVFDATQALDATTFAINFAIALLVHTCVWLALRAQTPPAPQPPTNKFERRLKTPAPIWAVVAEDHYLRVITAEGSEMILMRLSDAISELSDRAGLQIHRSHWVARAGIHSATASAVTLHDGTQLAISRSNAKAAKAFLATRLPIGSEPSISGASKG